MRAVSSVSLSVCVCVSPTCDEDPINRLPDDPHAWTRNLLFGAYRDTSWACVASHTAHAHASSPPLPQCPGCRCAFLSIHLSILHPVAPSLGYSPCDALCCVPGHASLRLRTAPTSGAPRGLTRGRIHTTRIASRIDAMRPLYIALITLSSPFRGFRSARRHAARLACLCNGTVSATCSRGRPARAPSWRAA